ncbi:hypothetical protein EYF80_055522 [Liparis tanakae]|uniref:Uncharacterized protein n=1 Tax=Liparis tanakae TaxID=230148 RepID=A0A4Z2EZN5_9TELE|nr:hypothetical protein EYF80_055522 [Liparis tanakae]
MDVTSQGVKFGSCDRFCWGCSHKGTFLIQAKGLVLEHHGLYLCTCLCGDNIFHTFNLKKGKKKGQGEKLLFFRDGGSSRGLLAPTTSAKPMEGYNQFVADKPQLVQLRKQVEEKHNVMTTEGRLATTDRRREVEEEEEDEEEEEEENEEDDDLALYLSHTKSSESQNCPKNGLWRYNFTTQSWGQVATVPGSNPPDKIHHCCAGLGPSYKSSSSSSSSSGIQPLMISEFSVCTSLLYAACPSKLGISTRPSSRTFPACSLRSAVTMAALGMGWVMLGLSLICIRFSMCLFTASRKSMLTRSD